jgi:hypothetical protein
MKVFIVNENNTTAMSVIKKLSGVKNGQLIPVSPEEYKFVKNGGLIPIEIPDGQQILTTAVPQMEKKEIEKAKVAIDGPKPPGTSPKPPVS